MTSAGAFVGRRDIAIAAVLSALGLLLMYGNVDKEVEASVLAIALFLLVTVPLVWRRAAPVAALGAVLAGYLIHVAAIGTDVIRCGVVLPVVFLLAFSAAARLERRDAQIGLALALLVIAAESVVFFGAFGVVMAVVTAAVWGIGRIARSRAELAAELQALSVELRDARDEGARMEVSAARARLSTQLDELLQRRLGEQAWSWGRSGAALGLALCALLMVAGTASAATMVLQGRFACSDGGSLAGVRVELLQIHSRLLPEIPPNLRVANATHADANGGWGFRVSGGESNWRVRAVLVNQDVGVKDFAIPWHHYADTLRTQNNRPLADYGTQVVPGSECRLWRAFKAAADGFRADTGGGHPGGKVTVFDNAPTSGVPFAPYTDVFWPAGYNPFKNIGPAAAPVIRSVAQHEYAHTFRHALDGGEAHFLADSALFWYLRSHSGESCEQTNHGFAFNEGWAEYWADEVRPKPCPDATDFSIERNVAFELKRLQGICQGVTRGRMVAVLAQNRGRIHSMSDFSNALGCVPRTPIKRLGRARRPNTELLALARLRTLEGRKVLASANSTAARARIALARAKGAWPKALARGRLDAALAFRKTFSYLANPSAQRRITRLSDRAQVDRIRRKERSYARQLRAISASTLAKGASIFRKRGNAAGVKLLADARVRARRGDLAVLQAVGIPLPAPRQNGPSPEGINIIDVGAAPLPPAPLPAPPPPPPAPPVPNVDLVIARVYGDATTAENLCDIFADVRNNGPAAAPATMTRFLSLQPGQFDELVATPALGAGQTTTVSFPREYGDYNGASVTVDATRVVAETDETNNTASGFGTPALSPIGEQNSSRCRYP